MLLVSVSILNVLRTRRLFSFWIFNDFSVRLLLTA
jgi:hypothetical protein